MRNITFTILLFTLSGIFLSACSSAEGNKTVATNVSANIKIVQNSKTDSKSTEPTIENKTTESPKANNSTKRNSATDRDSVSGKEVTGTFEMKFENEDLEATNEIKIAALGDNKLKIEFDLSYPFRVNNERSSVNIGKAQGEAVIKGDTAIYSTNEDGGKCEIKIKFVKEGLIKVTQSQEGSGCGFGLNVSAQGEYKRMNSSKPVFNTNDFTN